MEIELPNKPTSIRLPFLKGTIGLGDAVANVTKALGVQPCPPCEERRKKLNQALQVRPWNT